MRDVYVMMDNFMLILVCNQCEMHYVGQTTGQFCSRWGNLKSDSRKYGDGAKCVQQHLVNLFCTTDHASFSDQILLTFLEKTGTSDLL